MAKRRCTPPSSYPGCKRLSCRLASGSLIGPAVEGLEGHLHAPLDLYCYYYYYYYYYYYSCTADGCTTVDLKLKRVLIVALFRWPSRLVRETISFFLWPL